MMTDHQLAAVREVARMANSLRAMTTTFNEAAEQLLATNRYHPELVAQILECRRLLATISDAAAKVQFDDLACEAEGALLRFQRLLRDRGVRC